VASAAAVGVRDPRGGGRTTRRQIIFFLLHEGHSDGCERLARALREKKESETPLVGAH